MKKSLLVLVILLSMAFGQKKDQGHITTNVNRDIGLNARSLSETVPRRLSYQGLLTQANGRAISDGSYEFTFKLYEDLVGGNAFWEESQVVQIEGGVVSATLGSVVPIDQAPNVSFLEVIIDGTVLSPRQEMTSVFYSVISDTAKYAQGGNYIALDNIPDLTVFAKKDTLSFYVKESILDSVAFTGDYSDLENVPDLSGFFGVDTLSSYILSDSLNYYTLTSDLSPVATSNDYSVLNNLPDLDQFATLDTLESYALFDSLGTIATQSADNVNITGGSIIDINAIAVADGGTGASDITTARSNLGLEIGVDVQAYDADLADLADGTLSASKIEHLGNVTSDVQAQIDAIGDGPISSLEDLGVTADSTELNFVDGVTSDIQNQLDAKQDLNINLTNLSLLEHNHDDFIVSDGSEWVVKNGADARSSLGLGSIATQSADNVNITGGSIANITALAVADGGTGAEDITTARSNLGLEIGVDVQAYDADLVDLADGELSATKVQYAITTEGTNGQVWTSDGDGAGSWGDPAELSGAGSTIDTEDLTPSRALVSNSSGKVDTSIVTLVELGYMSGVTSGVQQQLNAKQDLDDDLSDLADGILSASKVENNEYFITSAGTNGQVWTSDGDGAGSWGDLTGITGAASTIDTEDLTASRVIISNTDGKVAVSDITNTELDALDDIDSNIQFQLDSKQKIDNNLSNLIALDHSDGNFIVSDGTAWVIENGADARNSLGLGTIATQSSDNVAITGGAITDISDIAIADGGTGASDVTTARSNLGLEIGVDVQAYDADLADLADGELSASKVQYAITTEGTNGQVWTSDGDGAGDWVDPGGLTGAGSTIDSEDLTASRALVSNASGKVEVSDVTSAELSYLDGVTSSVQTQLDAKQAADADLTDLADGTLTASKVENNEYFITSAGTNGQVWTSDGDGAGNWVSNTAATNINGLTDALVEDTGSMYVGNDPSSTTDAADYNVAFGTTALDAVTTGDANTAIGYDVLTTNTVGTQNTASGYRALKQNESGSYNTATGYEALFVNTNSGNSAFGWRSLRNNTSGTYNTASGYQSLGSNTEGDRNIAYGYRALFDNTTADFNTAIGAESLYDANRTADQDGYNTAIGYQAGNTGTNDITTGNKNTLLGSSTAASDEAGTNQSVIGYGASGQADNSVTLGNADVTAIYMSQDKGATVYAAALGFGDVAMTLPTADGSSDQVLKTNGSGTLSWGSAATSINGLSDALVEDTGSMYVGNDPSSTTDAADYNVAFGTTALDAVTTGDSNTALGYDALSANLGGNRNTAVGANSLRLNTTGITNVAVGSSALDRNTTSNSNTAVGHASSFLLNSGSSNVTVGYESGKAVTSADNNVLIGSGANPSDNAGTSNQIVVGYGATGQANNSVTLGNADVTAVYMSQDKGATVYAAALGFGSTSMTLPTADGSSDQVLKTNGSGTLSWGSAATSINGLSDALIEDTGSMYVGNDPSSTTDAADYNVAIGTTALDAVTTGDNNTAVGYDAMTANTTGSYNTAFGYKSLESNENGNRNIAIGMQSLQANSSGNYNTAVGMYSLYASATAAYNTAMGFNALKLVNRTADTDGYNTALGYNAGTTGTNDITTGNKNTLLGASTAASVATGTNQTVIGYGTSGQANNSITLGNADVTAVYMAQDQGATVYAAGVDITGSSGLILENDETITNATDGTIVIDGKADFNDNAITGYGADLQTESGTSKTLAAADNGTIIVCSSNSEVTITVPASLPSGFNCMIIQNGSGQVSLSASSTTLNNRNGSKTAGQYAILTLVHLGSDIFVVSGDTSS